MSTEKITAVRAPAFAMSANIHGPIVKDVYRLSDDLFSVMLGAEKGYDHMAVIVSTAQWYAIVRDADARISELSAEKLETWPGPTNTDAGIDRDDPIVTSGLYTPGVEK